MYLTRPPRVGRQVESLAPLTTRAAVAHMSSVRARHPWAIDFTEPDSGAQKFDLPKPPGYTELHAQDLDESKVAVRKVDQMSLKLKVRTRARASPPDSPSVDARKKI